MKLNGKAAREEIEATFRQMEPFTLGFSGLGYSVRKDKARLALTPKSVRLSREARFWQAQAKFTVAPGGSRPLGFSAHTQGMLNVYEGNLKFPEVCPVCLEPGTHYEIREGFIARRSISRKAYIPNTSADESLRIGRALLGDRYWYAIPFCDRHGKNRRTLHFKDLGDDHNVEVTIRNREYAQRFATLNSLSGTWLTTAAVAVQRHGWVGVFALAGPVVYPPSCVVDRLSKGEWPAWMDALASNPLTAALAIVAWLALSVVFIAFVYGYFLKRKHGQAILPKEKG